MMMDHLFSFLTWETIVIGALVILILYKCVLKDLFAPAREPVKWEPPKPVELRDFTLDELRTFDGTRNTSIYIAVKGKVYDVTRGREFYGPGGPYHIFAGRDATRALALHSTDPRDVENASLEGLTADQLDTLNDFIMTFEMKYPVMGYLKRTKESTSSEISTNKSNNTSQVSTKSDVPLNSS